MIKKNFAKNAAYPSYRNAVQARPTMIANAIGTCLAKVRGVYLNIHKKWSYTTNFANLSQKSTMTMKCTPNRMRKR